MEMNELCAMEDVRWKGIFIFYHDNWIYSSMHRVPFGVSQQKSFLGNLFLHIFHFHSMFASFLSLYLSLHTDYFYFANQSIRKMHPETRLQRCLRVYFRVCISSMHNFQKNTFFILIHIQTPTHTECYLKMCERESQETRQGRTGWGARTLECKMWMASNKRCNFDGLKIKSRHIFALCIAMAKYQRNGTERNEAKKPALVGSLSADESCANYLSKTWNANNL